MQTENSEHAVYARRMLVMAATLQLLDAAQRAVRTTTDPPLAVSLMEIRYPRETGYCPGVAFTGMDDRGFGDAVTVEVGTMLDEAGRVGPAYHLRGLGHNASLALDAGTWQDPAEAVAAALAVFARHAKPTRLPLKDPSVFSG